MKKLSIVILMAAFAAWSCKNEGSTATTSTTTGAKQASRIVYVNTDTLLNQYDYYKDVVKEFQQKRFQLENELANKAKSFQNEVAFFQNKAQQGGMTQEQLQTTQMQLQQKEQNIMAYRDKAGQDLVAQEAKKTDELLTKIQDYLKKYNSDNKYDMVIGYSKGGGVLYAKEDMDITKQVLEGLNKEYGETKAKK
ncbi:MAG: OmpH family outer membrane protein [Spirosomaceae bacterium]|jgi:outer membrane protein|nr:OmpH family outer membrane protein [Spirosomataceae bacterium]